VSDSENEFTYDMKGKTGPDKWGDLKPDWNLCKMGSMQSPIDFSNDKIEKVTNLEELQTNYRPSRASIKNRGYDIKVSQYQKCLMIFAIELYCAHNFFLFSLYQFCLKVIFGEYRWNGMGTKAV